MTSDQPVAPDPSVTSGQPRVSPVWLVLTGIVSVQVGAAVAKRLFGIVDPTAIVWLRLTTSAVLLLVMARPRVTGRDRSDWLVAAGFGLTLVTMNWAIYQSFARIPLGLAVTIEFVGPLSVAVLGSRRARDLLWGVLAAAGVVLLGAEPGSVTVAGVVFALIAGTGWACYILLSVRTGARWPGLEGLAVASLVGAVLITPYAVAVGGRDLLRPEVLGIGALVGVLSSVVPYSVELIALRTLPTAVFGILMSLEPAVAALAAALILHELLSPLQVAAVACVVAASIGATRSGSPIREPAPD